MPSPFRDALEEATTKSLPPDHVVRRVEDWLTRINALYALIVRWLPSGYCADLTQTTSMQEELMVKAGVPATELPILRIYRDSDHVLTIQPYALWIIGANGRLKAFGPQAYANIVDRADNFESPEWNIAIGADRHAMVPLTQDEFLRLLS